jgi:hypothetical protein
MSGLPFIAHWELLGLTAVKTAKGKRFFVAAASFNCCLPNTQREKSDPAATEWPSPVVF